MDVAIARALLAQVGFLSLIASGIVMVFGGRRLAGRLFMLGIAMAFAAGFVQPEWLP